MFSFVNDAYWLNSSSYCFSFHFLRWRSRDRERGLYYLILGGGREGGEVALRRPDRRDGDACYAFDTFLVTSFLVLWLRFWWWCSILPEKPFLKFTFYLLIPQCVALDCCLCILEHCCLDVFVAWVWYVWVFARACLWTWCYVTWDVQLHRVVGLGWFWLWLSLMLRLEVVQVMVLVWDFSLYVLGSVCYGEASLDMRFVWLAWRLRLEMCYQVLWV